MCDPQNLAIQDELRTFLGYDIRVVVATERDIKQALDRYYGEKPKASKASSTSMEDDDELAAAAAARSTWKGRST